MLNQNHWIQRLASIAGCAIVVFAASIAGVFVANHFSTPEEAATGLPPIVLNADSASSGKAMSMATGYISNGVEGLFVLDHLAGTLQCWIVNSRTGDVGAIYTAQPSVDLGLEKIGDVDYVMTTGQMSFNTGGRTGALRPAGCICYVGDGNTGKVVGYGLNYDSQLANKGGQQEGFLNVICKGIARDQGLQRDK